MKVRLKLPQNSIFRHFFQVVITAKNEAEILKLIFGRDPYPGPKFHYHRVKVRPKLPRIRIFPDFFPTEKMAQKWAEIFKFKFRPKDQMSQ